MAVNNKKDSKKVKKDLNTKKVIVNSSNKATPPSSVGTIVSGDAETTTTSDSKEFEEFYNKALQQYLVYKKSGVSQIKKSGNISKITKISLKVIYKVSIIILLTYLLKLYIVYQMRTYISVTNMIPTGISSTYSSFRMAILVSFQNLVNFLQKHFGVFENLKLKNEKTLLVENIATGLRSGSSRTNLESVSSALKLFFAIVVDYLRKVIPERVIKYVLIAIESVKTHLGVFNQRVFVETANIWKHYHLQSYEYFAYLISAIINKMQCYANCSLEELRRLLF
ncbi:hypothetical protein QEN19_000739 [Hanseniaspora menglaensis]